MNDWQRMDYRERAHLIVDEYDTDVTHEQVDAWNDQDLQDWIDNWDEDAENDYPDDNPGFDCMFLFGF